VQVIDHDCIVLLALVILFLEYFGSAALLAGKEKQEGYFQVALMIHH